jgi:hypothetical protein
MYAAVHPEGQMVPGEKTWLTLGMFLLCARMYDSAFKRPSGQHDLAGKGSGYEKLPVQQSCPHTRVGDEATWEIHLSVKQPGDGVKVVVSGP